MPKKQKNIETKTDLKKETIEMISGASIPWEKSREQVWSELEKKMESSETPGKTIIFRPWMRVAAAAVLALLIGISAFMQLYTKTIKIPAGQHGSIYLPDNSTVKMNAQSTLAYKPLWWNFSRQVKFEGEAYFEVQKGEKFAVKSDIGKTIVLGTSFNIYSRNDNYQVTCVSGNVKVVEKINHKGVILNYGQKATLDSKGILKVETDINTEHTLSWIDNRFSFTSVSLQQVFEEIGRQYNVQISLPKGIDKSYTGTFIKQASVEQTLNLVCRPFNLKFTQKPGNEYIISKVN